MGQGQRGMARMTTNLEVSSYSGDPLKGGQLINTVNLTPPARQGQKQRANGSASGVRVNPLAAQAPKDAKFAVIRDRRGGARILDLSRAGANDGAVGRGGRGLGGPDGQNGPPKSPSR